MQLPVCQAEYNKTVNISQDPLEIYIFSLLDVPMFFPSGKKEKYNAFSHKNTLSGTF